MKLESRKLMAFNILIILSYLMHATASLLVNATLRYLILVQVRLADTNHNRVCKANKHCGRLGSLVLLPMGAGNL